MDNSITYATYALMIFGGLVTWEIIKIALKNLFNKQKPNGLSRLEREMLTNYARIEDIRELRKKIEEVNKFIRAWLMEHE